MSEAAVSNPSIYRLAPGVKLRGYRLVPRAFYYPRSHSAIGLNEDEFATLLLCDGKTELPDSPLLRSLVDRSIAEPCAAGKTNEPWQEYRYCDNRYFPAAYIAITGRCSFKCKHCFNAADDSPATAELSKDEIFDILAQLDECGVHRIEITGGEPMLHPAFMDIMREIAARHFHLSELITTAHYLKPEALDEFQRLGLDPMFKVSYDGVGFHDEFRGVPGAEERVVSNIRLLASRGFRAYVHTNVNEWNRGVLLETILKNARLGASYTKVLRTFEVARPAGHKLPVLDMEAYFDLALDTLEAYIQTGETMPLQLWHFASAHPASKRYTLPFAVEHDKYRDSLPLCRVIRGAVQIDYEGNLWPCMYMSGECKKRGVSFGNIREKRIAGILRDSDYLNVTCRTAGELKMANAKCAACRFWRVCAGGCRSFAMLYSDTDYLAHDPTKCLFFNKYLGKTASMFAKHGYECGNDLSFLDLKEEN